jgi:hypothetical protein
MDVAESKHRGACGGIPEAEDSVDDFLAGLPAELGANFSPEQATVERQGTIQAGN